MKRNKKLICAVLILLAVLTAVFLAGRYGWKLFGFSACESAAIIDITVTEGQVSIEGVYPGSFPRGFLDYHSVERDGALFVGFRFDGIFGYFETGHFEIDIPIERKVEAVYIKTRENEYQIWPEET